MRSRPDRVASPHRHRGRSHPLDDPVPTRRPISEIGPSPIDGPAAGRVGSSPRWPSGGGSPGHRPDPGRSRGAVREPHDHREGTDRLVVASRPAGTSSGAEASRLPPLMLESPVAGDRVTVPGSGLRRIPRGTLSGRPAPPSGEAGGPDEEGSDGRSHLVIGARGRDGLGRRGIDPHAGSNRTRSPGKWSVPEARGGTLSPSPRGRSRMRQALGRGRVDWQGRTGRWAY